MEQSKSKSLLTRSAWMGLALFFLIFSCPVKKYIRLQLYKQHPLKETSSAAQQISIKEIKDCSIADKQESQLAVVLHHMMPDANDLTVFYLATSLSVALFFFFRRTEEYYIVSDPSPGSPGTVPLYLRLRHLQV